MALRIKLGQYYPADSPIHRLDPRTKVGAALVLMISVFFITDPRQLVFGYAFMLVLLALARIPATKVVESVRPIVAVLLLLSLFNLFLVKTGDVLWAWGILTITTDSLRVALLYSLRLVIALVAAALMLLTTTPTQLTDAFDAALAPLTRLDLPGHELAMVFSLMLRFIPTLADEAQAVVDAQTSRGAEIGQGSPLKRVRAIVPVLVALLASSLHHADGLSRALDARCYEGGARRTHYHPLHFGKNDLFALVTICAYIAVLALLA